MDSSFSLTFNSASTTDDIVWARLEQEYKKEDESEAGITDIHNMLSYGSNGLSAKDLILNNCSYATISDELIITVKLDFFVWISEPELQYVLTYDTGELSEQTIVKFDRSFDVIFQGANSVTIPYLFEGELELQSPVFLPDGTIVDYTPEVDGSIVTFPEDVYCVLRAKGTVTGHQYTMTMELDKTDENGEELILSNLDNTIVVTWKIPDEDDGTDSMTLDIPDCVQALMELCGDGTLAASHLCGGSRCKETKFVVYYSTCTGDILLRRWEENE